MGSGVFFWKLTWKSILSDSWKEYWSNHCTEVDPQRDGRLNVLNHPGWKATTSNTNIFKNITIIASLFAIDISYKQRRPTIWTATGWWDPPATIIVWGEHCRTPQCMELEYTWLRFLTSNVSIDNHRMSASCHGTKWHALTWGEVRNISNGQRLLCSRKEILMDNQKYNYSSEWLVECDEVLFLGSFEIDSVRKLAFEWMTFLWRWNTASPSRKLGVDSVEYDVLGWLHLWKAILIKFRIFSYY